MTIRDVNNIFAITWLYHNAQIKSKLQHPPPRANPVHLTIFCALGVGNLTFACVGWGKLNWKVSNDFFFRAPFDVQTGLNWPDLEFYSV